MPAPGLTDVEHLLLPDPRQDTWTHLLADLHSSQGKVELTMTPTLWLGKVGFRRQQRLAQAMQSEAGELGLPEAVLLQSHRGSLSDGSCLAPSAQPHGSAQFAGVAGGLPGGISSTCWSAPFSGELSPVSEVPAPSWLS